MKINFNTYSNNQNIHSTANSEKRTNNTLSPESSLLQDSKDVFDYVKREKSINNIKETIGPLVKNTCAKLALGTTIIYAATLLAIKYFGNKTK